VEIPVTYAAKRNNVHVLVLTFRKASGTSLQISQEFNIVFLAPGDSEGSLLKCAKGLCQF